MEVQGFGAALELVGVAFFAGAAGPAGRQIGLVGDTLLGQEEVVIKPLGASLQSVEGMAGATITGDGKIALILDVPGLMRRYASRY